MIPYLILPYSATETQIPRHRHLNKIMETHVEKIYPIKYYYRNFNVKSLEIEIERILIYSGALNLSINLNVNNLY